MTRNHPNHLLVVFGINSLILNLLLTLGRTFASDGQSWPSSIADSTLGLHTPGPRYPGDNAQCATKCCQIYPAEKHEPPAVSNKWSAKAEATQHVINYTGTWYLSCTLLQSKHPSWHALCTSNTGTPPLGRTDCFLLDMTIRQKPLLKVNPEVFNGAVTSDKLISETNSRRPALSMWSASAIVFDVENVSPCIRPYSVISVTVKYPSSLCLTVSQPRESAQ